MIGTSPFLSDLQTNHAATDEEKQKLKAFLTSPLAKLAGLASEIEQVETHRKTLVEQREKLFSEINKHKVLMSPIRYLPDNVLEKIFLKCLPTTHDAIISPRYLPLLLTHVCNQWRRIAFATPALWASIHIPLPKDMVDRSPNWDIELQGYTSNESNESVTTRGTIIAHRLARAITEWFGRSGACPLSITIYDRSCNKASVAIYNIILDALIPFRARWGALDLSTAGPHLAPILSIPATELPLLHTLNIRGSQLTTTVSADRPPLSSGSWKDSGLLRAPKLRKFMFTDYTEDICSFPLQWGLLTSLKLCHKFGVGISFENVASILLGCPLLRECRVEISSPHPDGVILEPDPCDLPTVIPLKHLAYLALASSSTSLFICKLLDILDVPALEHFRLDGFELFPEYPFAWSQFNSFLIHKVPGLRALCLNPHSFSRSQFFASLRLCSKLEHLELIGEFWTPPSTPGGTPFHEQEPEPELLLMDNAFWKRLLGPVPAEETEGGDHCTAQEVLMPRLRKLSCESGTADFSDACLIKAIKERNATASVPGSGQARLASIHVPARPRLPRNVAWEALSALEQEGVECVLKYSRAIIQLSMNPPTAGIPGLNPPNPLFPYDD